MTSTQKSTISQQPELSPVKFEKDLFGRVGYARRISLVPVPVAWLNEAALANVALVGFDGLVTPDVRLHIANLPDSEATLETGQPLSFAPSLRVISESPYKA